MIKLENAISNLETNIRWIENTECHQFPGWGNVTMAMRDALELLKEQKDDYKNILSDYENLAREHEKLLNKKIPLITNGQEVVRCKDCNRHLECDLWIENGDDWFCADGERRTNDEM